jgi:cytoskeletal protein CcmA (bactofilin family)
MRRWGSVTLGIVLLVAVGSTVAGAQAPVSGGQVVVEEGETVSGLTTSAGSVVVRGTVDGDVQAFSGTVDVTDTGRVTGDVNAFSGTVTVDGAVDGDLNAFAGNVDVTETGRVGSDLNAATGTLTLDGTVGGDVTAGAETTRLGPAATVGGTLQYSGNLLQDEGASVQGPIVRNEDLEVTPFPDEVPVAGGVFALYGLLVDFLMGAILLALFPGFSRDVATSVRRDPLVTGAIGVLALIAVPIVLFVLALTVVGIPLSILGAFAFGFVAWIATIYGRYAIGSWGLRALDVSSRYLALGVGIVLVALLTRIPIPFFGSLVRAIVFILGLGAITFAARNAYRSRREDVIPPSPTTFARERPGFEDEEAGAGQD